MLARTCPGATRKTVRVAVCVLVIGEEEWIVLVIGEEESIEERAGLQGLAGPEGIVQRK